MLAAGLTVLSFAGAGAASAHDEVRTLDGAGGVQGPTTDPGANSNAGGNGGGQGGDQGQGGGGGNVDNPGQGGGQSGGGQGGGGGNPNGNNGTVKIHSAATDEDDDRNEPKLPCTFTVNWYDYASAATGVVSVTPIQPTPVAVTVSGETTVPLTSDAAEGGTFDGQTSLSLDFTGEPAHNGYHVRIDVTTNDSLGSETKSKVVWVNGDCNPTTNTTPPGGCVAPCPTLQEIVLDPAPEVPQTAVLGETLTKEPAPAPAPAPATSGTSTEAAPAPVAVQGEQLARTGALTDRLLQLAGALLVLGGLVFMAGGKQELATSTRRR